MLNFFYDSLETLRKVKKPTNSDVTNLTIIIFVVVIIAALMFALMDGIFGEVYNMIFDTLKDLFGGSAPAAYPTEAIAPALDVPAVDVVADPVEAALDIVPTVEVVE